MRMIAAAVLCLAGCSQEAGNQAKAPDPVATATPVQAAGLTGLYEGTQVAGATSQMCIVERDGQARFGLVVWGANQHSCSGTGTAVRDGGTLRLAMAGDSECAVAARIEGGTVTLPRAIPDGCAYYCGARAGMGGASFARRGTTPASALEAKDLVGESLCADY